MRVCSAEDIDVDVDAREHISGNAIEMVNNPSKKPWMSVKEKTDEEMGPFSFSDHDSFSDEDDSISDASGSTHLESAGSEDALVSEEEVKNKKTEGVQIQALKACIGAVNTALYSLFILVCGSCETPESEEEQSKNVDEGNMKEVLQVKEAGGNLEALLSVNVEALPDDVVFPLPNVYSLGLFHRTNPIRVACANILTHPWFETVIQTFIFLSSIALIFDNPLNDPESDLAQGVNTSNTSPPRFSPWN